MYKDTVRGRSCQGSPEALNALSKIYIKLYFKYISSIFLSHSPSIFYSLGRNSLLYPHARHLSHRRLEAILSPTPEIPSLAHKRILAWGGLLSVPQTCSIFLKLSLGLQRKKRKGYLPLKCSLHSAPPAHPPPTDRGEVTVDMNPAGLLCQALHLYSFKDTSYNYRLHTIFLSIPV